MLIAIIFIDLLSLKWRSFTQLLLYFQYFFYHATNRQNEITGTFTILMSDRDGHAIAALILACGVKLPLLFNTAFMLCRIMFIFHYAGTKEKRVNHVNAYLDIFVTTILIIAKGMIVKKFVKVRRRLYDSMMEYLTLMNKVSVGVLILSQELINGKSR